MAFDIQDQTYSGTYSEKLIMTATYDMDTVNKGVVYVKGGIKKKHTIKRIQMDNPLRERQAKPVADDASPIIIDGRLLVPQDADVYHEYNPRELETNDLAEQLSTTILDRDLPQDLQTQLVQLLLNKVGEKFEDGIWVASKAYKSKVDKLDSRYQIQFFDGFLVRMVADALINLSSVSPVAITTSNILTILYDLIAQATKKKKALITDKLTFQRMKFLVSANTATIYQQALSLGTTFKGTDYTSGQIPPLAGYEVVRLAGLPDNTILFCRATDDVDSNLHVGMNSMADWQVKIAKTSPADETFFIQAKFKWDVQYGWPQEIFMYTTLTPNDFIVV